jgi:translocation and assembly module TamA
LKIFYAVFLLLLSIHTTLYAEDTNTTSHLIVIKGNTAFEISTIEDVLSVDRGSVLTFWRETPPTIDDKLLPTLEATLKSFYDSEGYYDASFNIEQNSSIVTVEIDAKKPVIVSDINRSLDKNLSSLIVLKKGERFRAKAFIQTKQNMIQALLNDGYCSYDLNTKAYVDLSKHTAELVYVLHKGDICTFGEPNIVGLKTIDKEIILSRVRAKKGERFDPKKVKATYNGIYTLNAFDSVQISVDRKFYNVVPIDIKLSEVENAYHFEGGLGYDTYIGPRVHVSLEKKNFYGNAQKTGIKLSWSSKEQLAIGNFYKPALFLWRGYGIDFGTEFGYSNLEYTGFQEAKSFAKLYLEHNEGRLKLRTGLALENIDITAEDNLKSYETLIQAVSEGNFLLLYPYVDVVYDARDDKLNPRYGYYLSASLEYGIDYKPNATSYIKSLIEARGIYTFDKLTLATVGKVGVVDEKTNSLPESKLFFAGGSYSNRAYGFNTMGVITSKRNDTIFGASTWVNLSIEADYPIVGNLYGALFNDNTMLNDTSYDYTGEVISSAGLGIRYMTPIGPFKVDVGWNVNKPSEYGISFQIGQSF